MKNWIVFLAFILSAPFLFAQQIEISEAPRAKDNGTYNSFLFELPDVGKDEAESDWKKFISDFKGKAKYDRKKKMYVAESATMPRLSSGAVGVFAKIIEDKNPDKRTTIIVWFESGGSFIDSETDSLAGAYAHEILTEYAMTTSKHHAQSVVVAEEKRLTELERDLKRLRKDNSDYHKDISKAKESIAKNEKNIEINELDQEKKRAEITAQKEAIKVAKENVTQFIQ